MLSRIRVVSGMKETSNSFRPMGRSLNRRVRYSRIESPGWSEYPKVGTSYCQKEELVFTCVRWFVHKIVGAEMRR
jgi:hypothetical protein